MFDLDPQIKDPPDEAIFCILCRGTIALFGGCGEKYLKHLVQEHGVYYNREWLFNNSLVTQKPLLAKDKGLVVENKATKEEYSEIGVQTDTKDDNKLLKEFSESGVQTDNDGDSKNRNESSDVGAQTDDTQDKCEDRKESLEVGAQTDAENKTKHFKGSSEAGAQTDAEGEKKSLEESSDVGVQTDTHGDYKNAKESSEVSVQTDSLDDNKYCPTESTEIPEDDKKQTEELFYAAQDTTSFPSKLVDDETETKIDYDNDVGELQKINEALRASSVEPAVYYDDAHSAGFQSDDDENELTELVKIAEANLAEFEEPNTHESLGDDKKKSSRKRCSSETGLVSPGKRKLRKTSNEKNESVKSNDVPEDGSPPNSWLVSAKRRCEVRLKILKCPELVQEVLAEKAASKKTVSKKRLPSNEEPQKLFTDDFAEECKTKCELCSAVFKVSFLKFHLESIHNWSMKSYLTAYGEPQLEMAGTLECGSEGQEEGGFTVVKRVVTVHHRCRLCRAELLMIKSVVGQHVKTKHQVSLRTYILKYLKGGKEDGEETADVTKERKRDKECPGKVSSKKKRLSRDRKEVKYNVDSTSEESESEGGNMSKKPENKSRVANDTNDNVSKSSHIEPIKLKKIKVAEKKREESRPVKVYSDNMEDCCLVKCELCLKEVPTNCLRQHTRKYHEMDVASYKKRFGQEYKFTRLTYHLCKVCDKEIILCQDAIASHASSSHKLKLKEYNSVKRRKKDSDENSPSTSRKGKSPSQSQSPSSSSKKGKHSACSSQIQPLSISSPKSKVSSPKRREEVLKETSDKALKNEIVSPVKDKLVEDDNKWYNGNVFSCKKCQFKSSSLDNFKVHVKHDHGTSLQKFSGNYTRTENRYKCQICSQEVEHEKGAVREHVVNHCLTLELYGKLYVRSKKKEEVKTKEEVEDTKANMDEPSTARTSGTDRSSPGRPHGKSEVVPGRPHGKSEVVTNSNKDVALPLSNTSVENDKTSDATIVKDEQFNIVSVDNKTQVLTEEETESGTIEMAEPAIEETEKVDGKEKDPLLNTEEIELHKPKDGDEINMPKEATEMKKVENEVNASGVGKEINKPEAIIKEPEVIRKEPIEKVEAKDASQKIEGKQDSAGPGLGSGTSTISETEQVHVYMCPFPNCDFQTDFQGMKSGPAAHHGITAHATQPWEIKKHGLKWKKVLLTLEKRMSSMFGDL